MIGNSAGKTSDFLTVASVLDSARLLFDLQNVSQVVQSFSGCLEARKIALCVTDALVDRFNCVFARLWILQPDEQDLRLIASSGLHTHIDGSFARVPIGAYKVGKIAQNRIPFLSNQLADEPWVKDRDWAITNQIRGFAGYPLVASDRVIGVLATFSRQSMAPEFLEVLQVLCMTTTIALDAAMQVQNTRGAAQHPPNSLEGMPLSDQLAQVLKSTGLTLMGTEQPLPITLQHALLQATVQLNGYCCNYCRLSYDPEWVTLEAIFALPNEAVSASDIWLRSQFAELKTLAAWLDGELDLQVVSDRRTIQFLLKLPYPSLGAPVGTEPLQLSDREAEVMTLLAQGLRDREIAQKLYISESTVKFHVNNSLAKLKAKNRYQGVYKAALIGCI